MVFCTYCGQSFTRDEHLERHILTHTNVKPFKCFTCHMSFARRDLLQRHYTVHGRDQNNQEGLPVTGIIPKSAGRTPIACSNCAKTKTKCDKKFPCSRCAGRNLRCTLRPTRRASKNVNRIVNGEGAGSGNSSENGNGGESQNASSGNSPARDTQSQAPNPQASPGQPQQPQQLPNGQPQPQPQSQNQTQTQTQAQVRPPSAPHSTPHSRNPSISQSVQQLQNPTPEEKPINLPVSSTPPFFEHSPTNGLPASLPPSMLSPLPTPVNGFVSQTPMSGYDDFLGTVRAGSSDNGSSPPFQFDPWGAGSMGTDFDAMRIDPSMSLMSMSMEINMGAPGDTLLGMIPEMSPPQGFGPVQTPIQTPRMDNSFSDLEMGSSAAMFYPHRQSSIADAGVPDLGAIIAAQDGWNVFRCTPTIPATSCPMTAKLNLEHLERSLKNHEGWSVWRPSWDEADFQLGEHVTVAGLHEATRDKLLAITQSFLHKALDIHREGMSSSPSNSGESPGSTASNFILLPPAHVLEYFLRSYANSFERYYPTSPCGVLDANELMRNCNDKASSLLILMQIAQGAMVIPSIEARWLTGGLTEACRISLFDCIEKNIILAGDPIVLRAALLFTVQAAWSGDKWQMDISMGQRGMYFAMLRHSGILEPRHVLNPHMNGNATTETLWREWIQQESRSRLIYSWVMVDQDLSLFHDTAPLFSVTEFGAPMPDADRLWEAKTATGWSEHYNQIHEFSQSHFSVGSGVRPMSLRDLFRHFLDDEIITQNMPLTPMHLRLLLHPLQTMVCQYSQLLSCFSDSTPSRQRARVVTEASTRVRLEEVQALLSRWYLLFERYTKSTANPMCPMMQSNLVMWHLISLNAVTNFSEIERFARREGVDGSFQQMNWFHKRCISDVHEAVYHAGQVLRIVKGMPRGVRPPWWPGSIYRAAMVLWMDSTFNEATTPSPQQFQPSRFDVAVDSLPAEHPAIVRYSARREGIPVLTKRDGSVVHLNHGFHVLTHCIDVIDEGVATRFSDGIRGKLERLARG